MFGMGRSREVASHVMVIAVFPLAPTPEQQNIRIIIESFR